MKSLRWTALLVAILSLATVLPASATNTAQKWEGASALTLPTSADGLSNGYLPTLSCVSAGNCVAGGGYNLASGDEDAVIFTQTNNVWKSPITLRAPSNAATTPEMTIYGLSCGALGYCTAGGFYEDNDQNVQAFVDNEVGGTWEGATEVNLPSNALADGQDALVRSVSCSSKGNCSAIGGYLDTTTPISHSLGFTMTETNGTWSNAAELTFSTPTNVNPFVVTNQIDCAAAGNCVAVGEYTDANSVTQGLVVKESGGTWGEANALPLPGNASAYSSAIVSEVSCVSAGCTVIGTYVTNSGTTESMVDHESTGNWPRSTELVMPSGTETNPHIFLYGYGGISCVNATNCAAGGQFQPTLGNYAGFVVSEVNGVWKTAKTVALPSGAEGAGANGGVVAVTCPALGDCQVGAAYLDASGNYQGLFVSETNGVWATGKKLVLPGSASQVGVDGGVYAIACPTKISCTATGSYLQTSAIYQGFSAQHV